MPVVKTPQSQEKVRKVSTIGGGYWVNVKGLLDADVKNVRLTLKTDKKKQKTILIQPL